MARPARSSRTAAASARRSTVASAPMGKSIDSFGRVSKRVAPASGKKTPAATETATHLKDVAERFLATQQNKTISAAPAKPAVPTIITTTPATASRKRRASDLTADDNDSHATPRPPASVKRVRRRPKAAAAASTASTASAPIASFFLRVPKRDVSDSDCESLTSSSRSASTAPTTPLGEWESESECETVKQQQLPFELVDLIHLQAAFVKTLAIHRAHHGATAPIDVGVLCPSIAQAWGKRRVTVDDLCRCLGVAAVSQADGGPFLSDYGHGKIFIELPSAQQQQQQADPMPVAGEQLNRCFEANLRASWAKAAAMPIRSFIDSLPRAPITACASVSQSSALRAKGQRSLEELMRGIALRKQEKETLMDVELEPETESASQPEAAAPMSLLDRIRFRQLQRAQQLASGNMPSPQELERRAALQRAADIAGVLAMMGSASGSQQSRVSFPLAAILTKLRDSLRLPISREEGASCLRLLAKEVAPEWLQMVSMAGREIVVMQPNFAPSKMAIQARVQTLLK